MKELLSKWIGVTDGSADDFQASCNKYVTLLLILLPVLTFLLVACGGGGGGGGQSHP